MEKGFLNKFINNKIINVKAFVIFFAVLNVLDLVLLVATGIKFSENFLYIIAINFFASIFLQFLATKFGKAGLLISEILIFVVLVLTIVEVAIYKTYGLFMPISSLVNNAKNVTAHYNVEMQNVVVKNVLFVAELLILYIISIYILNKAIKLVNVDNANSNKKSNYLALPISILLLVICYLSAERTNDFSFNVQKYGLKTAFIRSINKTNNSFKLFNIASSKATSTSKLNKEYNMMDINFDTLEITENTKNCEDVNKYVSSLEPSNKNNYTGIFKGKNLILICAEAYSNYAIDETLTPTLYRLTNNGFRFNDYYVPSWGGSTSSGEFAFITGLVPTSAAESMKMTIGKNMCFTMPRILKKEGYKTAAFHNGNYRFYDRDITHRENLGFDYYTATANGLEDIAGSWPIDEVMIEKTFDLYKDQSPFCIYYMTLSGHAFYNDNNSVKVERFIKKVKEVHGDKYPDQVNNYICYQMYLEEALQRLIEGLEKSNLLNDTVICMTSDHFPYGLNSDTFTEGVNYIPDLYGFEEKTEFDRDKSMPILWCAELESKYKDLNKDVNEPTSSIDLLPTLLNLFGAEYDSRLIAGRDVFSNAEPIVVYANGSFITEKGCYSKIKGKFISNTNEEPTKEYVDDMMAKAIAKVLYSEFVVNYDYYNYIFTNKNVSEKVKSNIGIIGEDIPVILKGRTYDDYVEYFKKCNEKHLRDKNKERAIRDKKIAYFTFDDGPNQYNEEILKKLKANNIKATFFLVGTSNEEGVRKIKEEGHTIGLHSATHNYSYIYDNRENYVKDLYDIQSFVYKVTGEYSHYVRFPGGSKNKVSEEVSPGIMKYIRPLVEELGFEYYDWHVATGDSSSETSKERILSNIERALHNDYKEVIILMHDLHPVTVDVLDEAIALCKKYGYEFDKITDDTLPFHAVEDDY